MGGADTHCGTSGVAHFAAPNEQVALALLRELLTYLPQNNLEQPPHKNTEDPSERLIPALDNLVPENPKHPYDIKDLVVAVADDGQFLEVQADYAENIVIGFCRLAGRSVGVVANQPAYSAGALDIEASIKAARFVRFCDAISFLCLVPGPGTMLGRSAVKT